MSTSCSGELKTVYYVDHLRRRFYLYSYFLCYVCRIVITSLGRDTLLVRFPLFVFCIYISVCSLFLCLGKLQWFRNRLNIFISTVFKGRYSTHRYLQRLEMAWIPLKLWTFIHIYHFYQLSLSTLYLLTIVVMKLDNKRPSLVRK